MTGITHASESTEVIENLFIPLSDGRRLAARMWRPRGADETPVPAVIEYMPYRKRDTMRSRDARIHHYLADHGYASLRVDSRGSGDSDGLLRGEWEEDELDDGVEMIEWVAAQSWCTGSVGMIGKSWSGFTCLTLAARRPAALEAIVPVCCGDDRYDQSLHYTGGAFLVEQLWWADSTVLFNARPPDPEVVGDRWRGMWQSRLDDVKPWIDDWLDHQRRDSYWRRGSICEDWGAIQCAVLSVGGWADYLSRSVPRLLANLEAPCWGVVGPWGHHYPHEGLPGPSIGFLQECVRFFDRFLKKVDNGYEDTLAYRAWIQDYRPPSKTHGTTTGRWVAERSWPSPRIEPRPFFLGDRQLDDEPRATLALRHSSPLELGQTASEWLCMGMPGELPGDQRIDDGMSLTFDSESLVEPLEILGATQLTLDCEFDQPSAQLVARLVDVSPDGTAARVSLATLNLTRRDDLSEPTPLEPGRRYRVTVTFPDVGHAFAPGHRVRLALSTSYWPVVWPAPHPVTLTVHTGSSTLTLPRRPSGDDEPRSPRFEAPEAGPDTPITILKETIVSRRFERNPLTGESMIQASFEGGALLPGRRVRFDETATELGHRLIKTFRIREGDPLSATAEFRQRFEIEREDWQITIETSTRMSCTRDRFLLECTGKAWDGDRLVLDRTWSVDKPRDLM